jgi:hypothetical protein
MRDLANDPEIKRAGEHGRRWEAALAAAMKAAEPYQQKLERMARAAPFNDQADREYYDKLVHEAKAAQYEAFEAHGFEREETDEMLRLEAGLHAETDWEAEHASRFRSHPSTLLLLIWAHTARQQGYAARRVVYRLNQDSTSAVNLHARSEVWRFVAGRIATLTGITPDDLDTLALYGSIECRGNRPDLQDSYQRLSAELDRLDGGATPLFTALLSELTQRWPDIAGELSAVQPATSGPIVLLTVTAAAELLCSTVSGLALAAAKTRVSRAATAGDIRNNGKKGSERRLNRDSFSTWLLEQQEAEVAASASWAAGMS